jgi:Protein of unknown function (DUF2568)
VSLREGLSTAVVAASLTLQFLLELAALAAYGYWGYSAGDGILTEITLAITAPLAAAIFWGVFGSPKAPYHLVGARRLLLEIAFFGLAAAALAASDRVVLGAVFAAVVAANVALLHALGHGDFGSS